MDDTMKEDDKKKKKGVAIVIAVTPHAPKKPENTMKPDGKPMKKAWSILKERYTTNEAMEAEQALGVSPKEHKRRMLNEIDADGRDEYAQGRYQRGQLPRHMINTEEQQENEQFYDEDMETDMDNLPPDEIYEMFRQD